MLNWSKTCSYHILKLMKDNIPHRQPPAASQDLQTSRSRCCPAESSYWSPCTQPELPKQTKQFATFVQSSWNVHFFQCTHSVGAGGYSCGTGCRWTYPRQFPTSSPLLHTGPGWHESVGLMQTMLWCFGFIPVAGMFWHVKPWQTCMMSVAFKVHKETTR